MHMLTTCPASRLQTPPLAEAAASPRVRFRPELGFSSKPVIGPVITLVKRAHLRLQFYVLDDLARQADAAIASVEARLAAEIAMRERLESELEGEVRELEDKIRLLEGRNGPEGKALVSGGRGRASSPGRPAGAVAHR